MLTDKQEQFARKINEGMNQSDAYREVYDCENSSPETIWTEASLLASNPKVAQRIKELRDMSAKHSIMTAQERLEFLTDIVRGNELEERIVIVDGMERTITEPASVRNKISAIDIMNKMQGEYVTKIDANVDSNVNISIELTDE